jgi:glycosyltransferase involved in cell wall biosynthesis
LEDEVVSTAVANRFDAVASPRAPELTIVMPCLNEAETLADCIDLIGRTVREHKIEAEIVVADNGSTDGSIEIAEGRGARVIRISEKGYGNALMGGIEAARGTYVIMGDADMSYDFGDIPKFLEELRLGADLVMGNRFRGGIKPGAMPALHRYLGNPVLSAMGRLFFNCQAKDFHCGLRGFNKDAYWRMNLHTTGMEFASEMVVKASLFHMRVAEVPTTLSPDGRSRPPHLRSWRDGWRHLRFLLLYSPRWLFFYPGLLLMLAGLVACAWLALEPRTVFGVTLDVHTLLYALVAVSLGFQGASFSVYTKIFAINEGLVPEDPRLSKAFKYITLESGLAVGFSLFLTGLLTSLWAVFYWGARHFGPLDAGVLLRAVILAVLALTLGGQIIFSSFFLSVLGLRHKQKNQNRAPS